MSSSKLTCLCFSSLLLSLKPQDAAIYIDISRIQWYISKKFVGKSYFALPELRSLEGEKFNRGLSQQNFAHLISI